MTSAVTDRREQQDDPGPSGPLWWVRTIVSWLLLFAMVAVLALLVVIPRITGSQTYTVLTGSMEPTLSPGTLIYVKETDANDLNGGDVITFQPESGNPMVNTHRIEMISIAGDGERRFITRGDANPVRDSGELVPGQIRGKVWFSVPYLGKLHNVISGDKKAVLVYTLAGLLIAYSLWMAGSSINEKFRTSKKSADSEASANDGGEPAGSIDEGSNND